MITNLVSSKTMADNYYSRPNLDVTFRKWFPFSKVPSPQTKTLEEVASLVNQKRQVVQQRQVSPELVIEKQFLKERRQAHSTNASPLPTHQSHQLKMRTELPTPRDKLSLEHVTSPPRKKSKTTFRSQFVDLKEDEEQTCLNEIRKRRKNLCNNYTRQHQGRT
jgi:hypothetical protein